jgi:hypothetical protein
MKIAGLQTTVKASQNRMQNRVIRTIALAIKKLPSHGRNATADRRSEFSVVIGGQQICPTRGEMGIQMWVEGFCQDMESSKIFM